MTTLVNYTRENLNVDFYLGFLTEEESQAFYEYLEENVPWNKTITPGRRVNQNYGDDGLSYTLKFGGYDGKPVKMIERKCLPWADLPVLDGVKGLLYQETRTTYNYCVVQRYPSGRVGINPHKDKEMRPGTCIAGLSVGATRTLTLTPPRYNKKDKFSLQIELPPGSLYIFKDPTNRHWQHSIEKDETTEPRISLTFRTI